MSGYINRNQARGNRKPVDPLLEQFPANQAIRTSTVRLIDQAGANQGVIETKQALWRARDQGLDLVLISPEADPPVAKILEYTRFLYEQKKSKKEAAKRSRESQIIIKEIQLRPVTDQHDIATKLNHAKHWLEDQQNKIKIVIKFRGREMSFAQRGFEVMSKFISELGPCKVEREPSMSGNQITAMIAPTKSKKIDSTQPEQHNS
jgi:translation initiation factor IF-3